MMPPYTMKNSHKMAQRVNHSTGVEVISCRRRWLCWPLAVVSYELADQPEVLPLDGMLAERQSMESVPAGLFRERIFEAIAAPACEVPAVLSVVGIPWWARPLAEAGDGNRVAVIGGHPLVVVVRDGRAVGLIAGSRARKRTAGQGPGTHGWPTHDIHGRPWGTGRDPMGLRITTPFDRQDGAA